MNRTAAGTMERPRARDERMPPVLTADWRDLAILNYEVDRSVLAPRVPEGCALDDWHGRHFVTLTGFRVRNARMLGVAVPLHSDFLAVDFRFYVRRQSGNTWRRGVVSIQELTPRRLIAFMARRVYGGSFVALPMRQTLLSPSGHDTRMYTYGWRRRGDWESLMVRSSSTPLEASHDSEERFIADRYLGFTRLAEGGTYGYQVEHAPWRLYRGDTAALDADVPRLFGPEFVDALSVPPRLALAADGSSVIVRRPRRLT